MNALDGYDKNPRIHSCVAFFFPQQSFKQLVEAAGNSAPHRPLDEMQVEGKDGHAESVSGAEDPHPWDNPSNWALAAEENVLSRLLKDLMWTSKRRYKKGGLRSCFGVRLERIGSFSGLGC